jgi:hypothetical protein
MQYHPQALSQVGTISGHLSGLFAFVQATHRLLKRQTIVVFFMRPDFKLLLIEPCGPLGCGQIIRCCLVHTVCIVHVGVR